MLLSFLRDEKMATKQSATQKAYITQSSESSGVEFAVGSFESGWPLAGSSTTPKMRGGDKCEMVRVEYETFKLLLRELTPWGRCTQVDVAEKLFWVSCLI